ncbi:HD domain-containing protein [Coniella lustricola]|uniref:5'-deoxynucleotidase n=1 Tax=Coniella lustricola TaxID=2025994 RepID=A0A2T3A3F1_9PEZI|nr:HD domain-containing protein [Coniella lustricola]
MSPSAVNTEALDNLGNELKSANPDPSIVNTPKVTGDWTVAKVLATISTDPPVEGSSSPVPYFHLLERLKTTKREGWRRFGILRGESISDHMYRMALISMFAPPSIRSKVDLHKCMKMCLIHDMAESLVGDITPVDGVAKPEKNRREAATMDYITKNLLGNVWGGDGKSVAEDILAVWQEYEDSETLESHFVHDIDKLELLLQMVEYEKRGERKLDLGEFAYVATRLALDETKQWAQEVLKEREAYWGSKDHVHGEKGVDGGITQDLAAASSDYYEGSGGANS